MARKSKSKSMATPQPKHKPFVLGKPPSKEERCKNKVKNELPSPPSSQHRLGGPGRKELEFAKKMQGLPNEIKSQVVRTNLPEKNKWPVETDDMRLKALAMKRARDAEIRADKKPANINIMMDRIINAFPGDADMVVAPSLLWHGGVDMTGYYEWLLDEYYEGDMPEIVRRANAFRGFPQLDDEDFNQVDAAERYAYYRSQKGRDELRPYLPAIKKYAPKGEYELMKAQVNGQTASYAMAADADTGELQPYKYKEEPYPSESGPSPCYAPSEAGPSAGYHVKIEYLTPTLGSAIAGENLSSRLDRSVTLGRSPQDPDRELSPAFELATPNTDTIRVKMNPALREMIKDEVPHSAESEFAPILAAVRAARKDQDGDDVQDEEEMSAAYYDSPNVYKEEEQDEYKDEVKDEVMSTATDLSVPLSRPLLPLPEKEEGQGQPQAQGFVRRHL
ncbi:uncharacterized protein PG998_005383 [Apiospora kogelbergensis]|uniref:uncharacterized protein n=1 Tax=Apiospora kogelbergensis TaxID=1337665 RepID=UPI00312D3BB1